MLEANAQPARRRAKRTLLGMLSALAAAFGASTPAWSAVPCGTLTDAEAVEAAIQYHVDRGLRQQYAMSQGRCMLLGWKAGEPCVNSQPYLSVQEFRVRNPDCCKIADPVPGDFSDTLYPYIVGEKQPRVFLIEMTFRIYYLGEDGQTQSRLEHTYEAVDCRGNVMHGGFRL